MPELGARAGTGIGRMQSRRRPHLSHPPQPLQSSGLRHSHTATIAIVAGTASFTQPGTGDSASTVALSTIIVVANHLARLGTAP